MDKIADVYDFAIAWAMEQGDPETLTEWWKALGVSFEEFKEICKSHRWWVKSMEALEGW